ncbi:putative GTP-binding protein 6 isoform X2 [Homo sapiens]|nr:putative GTP-binding protein 6 isoform X2 [Homo sapiens]XP_047298501.1 putative GTP-binding protein 6 isoform X2 [Homo sapiens]XP_047298716.1 putative GTP-binding protein 6 isoform X2 [Homo sapiens]XP_047298717.1 putative GTP-binding protein 6 isoform X2 [Homo sapiens]
MVVSTKTPDRKLIFGKGNFEHLTEKIRGSPDITCVFLNVERMAAPTKKELEAAWGVEVFDRFTVVLHIFRCNARTKEARLQVALAEMPLHRSNLKRDVAHLYRGVGSRYIMGSGESFMQLQQRLLREKEAKIRKALDRLRKKRHLLRRQRTRREFPVISVVGYTNCGEHAPRGGAFRGLRVTGEDSPGGGQGVPVVSVVPYDSCGEHVPRRGGSHGRRVGYTSCCESSPRRRVSCGLCVGYSSQGKTTLIKALTGDAAIQPRDQLFATLDVTAHAGTLPSRMTVLYVDTIGFLSQLPHGLIESFSATLEDVAHSDLILHVRDVSHPEAELQKCSVLSTLRGLQLPAPLLDSMVEVHNKVDLVPGYSPTEPNVVPVSALRGHGLQELKAELDAAVLKATGRQILTLRVRLAGAQLSWLYKEATVQEVDVIPEDGAADVRVIISNSAYGKFRKLFPG